MQEVGKVIEIIDNQAVILISSISSACGSCKACDPLSGKKKEKILTLPNTINAKPDDMIVLELKESESIQLSIIVYLFPLIMLIGGYFLGELIEFGSLVKTGDKTLAVVLSLFFLFISFVVIYFYDKKAKKNNKYSPHMVDFFNQDNS